MLNFTQKISGITACYELDEQQHILIHSVCDGRKVITKQKINLSNIDAEYSEATNLREFPVWTGSLALIMTFIAIPLLFLLFWNFFTGTDISPSDFQLCIGGIGLWLGSLWLLLHKWRNCRVGCFIFQSRFHYDFEINYLHNKRRQAYEFAETVSRFCNQKTSQTTPVAEHQFKNGLIKLFEDRMVLYNQFGVKHYDAYYTALSSKVSCRIEKSAVGNIIFGSLAGIFFAATLFMFGCGAGWFIYRAIGGTVDGVDILVLASFIIIGILPLALGRFFCSWCHPNRKYYSIVENNDAGIGMILEVGKDTADESEFISKLKKLLRDARKNKSKKSSNRRPPQDVKTVSLLEPDLEPEYTPESNITIVIRIIATLLNAVCCIALFSLWKKPGVFIIVGASTVISWLIAEHINNYFIRRKK